MAESWWLTSGTPWRSRASKTPDPDGNRLLTVPRASARLLTRPSLTSALGCWEGDERPGRGRSLTGGEGRSSRRLRQRRRSSSSACSFHCGRRTRSIPHNHPPSRPSPRAASAAATSVTAAAAAASAPAREREPARGSENARAPSAAATAHNLRPRPAAHAQGSGRTGARTPQGAGMGPGRRGPAPSPPTHAVAGLGELRRCR
ncbi:serine/arginine repetitive matrix protein 3-like [Trachypithecus francoisi]|uniref:serine/arginine repetitive matrix protein 3-like n=1 Tax=Trachypithecus francoisi TaxID=54180 RepID=UPI00141AD1DF|nr:serine/arginine repetitive matrix protein 3-like [Trachypithecus francoisi]